MAVTEMVQIDASLIIMLASTTSAALLSLYSSSLLPPFLLAFVYCTYTHCKLIKLASTFTHAVYSVTRFLSNRL